MDYLRLYLVIAVTAGFVSGIKATLISDLSEAQSFLNDYNTMMEVVYSKSIKAAWAFYTNITDHNREVMVAEDLYSDQVAQQAARNASQYNLTIMDQTMRREFIKIMDIGSAAQTDPVKQTRLKEVLSEMETIYSTAKVCIGDGECLPLEPDLTRLFATSRDHDVLLAAWQGWRDASGAKMKELYTEFVTLSNEALAILGHADTGAYWRSDYDSPEFEEEVRVLFEQLRPMYEQLHAYSRRKLMEIYGRDKFPESGHIPAHLLGNMWAQEWLNLVDDFMPFKGKPSMDVTKEMVNQGYTPLRIFQLADDFFGSLGMIRMPPEFWNGSMLEKPTDGREVVCHASAWDFYNRKDFRVQQCTDITQSDLETVHHEMGHVEYFLQYKHLPLQLRGGANPGFHEAVGDVISLSVQTPEHMKSIGLLSTIGNDTESDINFLMSMALQKIAFLPFGYLIDQWRWSVFRGDTSPEEYNDHWWDLRCRYQGVSPPVERSSSDFDPGAKYHIPANTPYIRYFVSFVIQFQFHKALCNASGYTGPLHRCDVYNNTEAGKVLGDMLKLGSSKPWTFAMQQMTGQATMDAQPLMEYFEPLLEFLRRENGNDYGWHPHCPTFKRSVGDNSAFSVLPSTISIVATIIAMLYMNTLR
ncbi:angiotensin-converting enzyme [Aplysia californica]|uniref:Angiotensin-converting enzyme n=1 Tax=Aplysia californica TaxID=6500 RepID=A0ABM1VS72_APLCA|nr:angiotensin-converting enzyme [Aplysia californica]